MRGRGERGEGHLDQVEETSSEGEGLEMGRRFCGPYSNAQGVGWSCCHGDCTYSVYLCVFPITPPQPQTLTPPYPTWPYWAAETPALSSTYPPLPPSFREADRDIFPVPPYLSQFAAEILLQECQGKRHRPLGQCCHHLPCQLSSPCGLLYLLQLVVIIIAIIAAILLTLISEPTHPPTL